MTLARHASEADIRSIPYAGNAVWRDVKLMRTALLDKGALLEKPHIRKILKHSNSYIANMSANYDKSPEVAETSREGTGTGPEDAGGAIDADGFDVVEIEEVDKTGEIDEIVGALAGLSIQNLRVIKSLIKNTDWK